MRNTLIFTVALILSLLLVDFVAHAAPPRARNGEIVRLASTADGGRHERAVALRCKDGAWRLELAESAPVATAQVSDVTAGVAGSKWSVAVDRSALVLDGVRFVAGHAYRVELPAGSLLVYLSPPAAVRTSRVRFEAEAAPTTTDDGIAISPKSAL